MSLKGCGDPGTVANWIRRSGHAKFLPLTPPPLQEIKTKSCSFVEGSNSNNKNSNNKNNNNKIKCKCFHKEIFPYLQKREI